MKPLGRFQLKLVQIIQIYLLSFGDVYIEHDIVRNAGG